MHTLQLRHIHKSYRSHGRIVPVLKDLNLEVEQGEFVSIIGGSGQGKSTLLNILGCLDRPDNGQYLIHGVPVNWDSAPVLAETRGTKIATIFQGFELIPHCTVQENVELSLRFQKRPREERKRRAREALAQVNLIQHASKYPYELSGGEQQRCAIARAICAHPTVLLADEPTGNLDPDTTGTIMALLLELNRKGMTLLFVTHDMQLALLAHRVAHLQSGRLEWWSNTHVQG